MIWPEGVIGLKVDIDTRRGCERGVPVLLDMLDRHGIKASFFMSWGPDNSGRALLKLLTNPRFFAKMLRSGAASSYGFKTALYGVLLPAPLIGAGLPDISARIVNSGHELELHAHDHRTWQDTLHRRDRVWVDDWFARALDAHTRMTGRRPRAFGAPGWVMSQTALDAIAPLGFSYLSCTRASSPFIPSSCGIPEIPGNLPCVEETGSYTPIRDAALRDRCGVLTLHAEIEGGRYANAFERDVLSPLLNAHISLVPLGLLFEQLEVSSLPVRPIRSALLAGRADECSV